MLPRIAVVAALLALVSVPAAASPALDVTITIGPEGTVSADSASFTFAANERATFSCSLDGARAVTCASPVSFSGLADGPHLFSVQARNRDARGAEFVAFDRRAWTVDRSVAPPPGLPPLVPGLPAPGGAPEPGGIVEALGDTDADGVAPTRDRCPATPPGLRLLAAGCAAVEIVASPRPFAEAADLALTRARGWQRSGSARLRPGRRLMANAGSALSRALGLVEDGAVCPGAREAGAAVTGLARGERRLQPLYRRLTRRLARLPRRGDAGPAETGIMGLSVAGRLTDTAQRETASLRGLLRRLCAAQSGPRRLTGTIAAVDDAGGLVTMNDGNVLALAGAVRGRLPSEGARASLSAVTFAGGGGIVRGAGLEPGKDQNGVELADPTPSVSQISCVALRVAPVQPFYPPLPVDGPYTLHDPKAYGTSPMALEAGMRLAAAKTCSEPGAPGTATSTFTVRSLRLRLSYTKLSTKKKVTNRVLAAELTPSDDPASLPADISATKAKLELLPQAKTCSSIHLPGQPPPCGLPKPTGPAKEIDVSVRPDGYYARAVYHRSAHPLDTQPAGSYATNRVLKVETRAPLTGTPFVFGAEGYSVSGGVSSRPAIAPIARLKPFAVYMDDFYSDALFPVAMTGTDKPSGLRWPRVKGKRNGKEFWYLTELPGLLRDLVSICPGTDSYYRLPFADVSTWRLGNGNFDDPNGGGHAKGSGKGNDQRYAFDFGYDNSDSDTDGDEGAAVRAARPGVVIDLQQNESGNSWKKGTLQGDGTKEDGPVPAGYTGVGNFVVIEHDDDTVSAYWHNRKGTTEVSVGERVERGQLLAKSGNTGNSSQPHLHWDVRTDWHLNYPAEFIEFPSTLVKVQDKNHDCWRPREADTYHSNNEPAP